MTAFPNLHALAYGEGGQRLSAELRVEAADALERPSRTCGGCGHWSLAAGTGGNNGWCDRFRFHAQRNHACNAHQPLTPAHDKEKS